MDVLLNVEPVTAPSDTKGLRHLYDLVESNVRSLKSLGVTSDSYGSLLYSVFLNKLPSELRLIVSRKVTDEEWDLDVLLKMVEQEVEARERATASLSSSQQQPRKAPDRGSHTAATLVSGIVPTNPSCCFCQQTHSSKDCQVVKQVEARKQILRKAGRCFTCLRRGHISRSCRSTGKCSNCSGRHHSSICERNQPPSNSLVVQREQSGSSGSTRTTTATRTSGPGLNPNAAAYTAATAPTAPTTTSLYVDANTTVLLQTARAHVYDPTNPGSSIEVRAILDTGSQRSYITDRAKNALFLAPEGEQCLSIVSFGANKGDPKNFDVVRVGVKTRDSSARELKLFVVPLICGPLASQPLSLRMEGYSHLDLADPPDGKSLMEVDMLIGSDHYWDLATGETFRAGEDSPVAIRTRLGWVLSGPVPSAKSHPASVSLLTTHLLQVDSEQCATEKLDDRLRSFWELESLGIRVPDKSVYEEFSEDIHFKEGRYEVSLPWKDVHDPLPDNHRLSARRLQGLLCRLRQSPAILRKYDTIIQEQIRNGIVEVVPDPDCLDGERVHYLPHHAVIRQDKATTKLRIVYDASAKSSGPSLNECLYTGPKFDQKILDILLRFRSHRVALIADIEKAFLMISMSQKDRDVLRFLWVDDISREHPEIVVLRFARVVFGVSSSPFLLNATVKHHLEQFSSSHPELVQNLLQSMYVDDVVSGADSEEHAYELYAESKQVLGKGGFNLRKFATNSQMLQARIDQVEKTPDAVTGKEAAEETYAKATLGTMQHAYSGEHKVLGVRWNPHADQLIFNLDDIAHLATRLDPTKRHVVSIVGKFYDPLGFLSPIIIRFKMLFQELCESKVDWDQPLTGRLLNKWRLLITDLQEGQTISIPRSYLTDVYQEVNSYRMYGFCDASSRAYAAVVYLGVETDSGEFVRFVVSKTRVAPVQPQTIPRLELLSALLLARLVASVSRTLQFKLPLIQPRCFTDSKVALYWIRGMDQEWKPFVQNRVNEIRKLMPTNCWEHCPGKDNPADIPSRGLTPLELSVNVLWRNGPDWLGKSEGIKKEEMEPPMPKECVDEKKKSQTSTHSLLVARPLNGLQQIMDCGNYSTLPRLLRVTAYLLKSTRIFKNVVNSDAGLELSAEEISEAERLWIIQSQLLLATDRKFDTWRKQFGLFQDATGIWRCGGRLAKADIPYSTQHPVLMHKDHPFTALIVKDAHKRVRHNGVKETLTELRSKYWIVKGRSFTRKIVYECVLCRKAEGMPFSAPPPPPLPSFRVKEEPPFSYTGVDFAGPLYIKTNGVTVSSKVWICLYTCCVTRAVHLDIVPDMSTQTFLRSFKRFAARRGLPKRIVSDNGKTFKAAARIIEAVMKEGSVQQYMSGVGIKWTFNLEKAPWWGGLFERMVKSTKRCLKKMIGRAKLSFDELLTAVTEVEAVINSRPLSYISSDDWEEPLTPSHLLIGRRALSLPDNLCCQEEIEDEDFELDPCHLSRRLKHLNNALNQFWRRWRSEYLLELRESHRYSKGSEVCVPVMIGDIVVVHDESQPRGFWKLAKVEDVIVGQDGGIRGALLRLPAKNGRSTLLRRPVQLLYPLEINCHIDRDDPVAGVDASVGVVDEEFRAETDPEESELHDEPTENIPTRRSQRAAARQANDRRKACQIELEDC